MAVPGKERRRLKRIVGRIGARFESEGLRGQGYIKNLHKRGMFLRSSLLPQPGADVCIVFEGPDGEKVEVVGTIRWTTDQIGRLEQGQPGFGILLHHSNADYLRFFETILTS